MKLLKRLIGFKWCRKCGRERVWELGPKYEEYFLCPHCDHLDRFDTTSEEFRRIVE